MSENIRTRMKSFLGTAKVSHSPEETDSIAAAVASKLVAGDVVCLEGELGAGKTSFVKGAGRQLGIDPSKISSPTFTLIHEYLDGVIPVYHFDFYRLKSVEEVINIGAEEYFFDEGICFIEWPSVADAIIPPGALRIHLEHSGNDRQIVIGMYRR